MARYRMKYPPGIFFITGGFILLYILLNKLNQPIQPIQPNQSNQPNQPIQVTQINIPRSDSRYDMAPQPLKQINIPTRIPDTFQSIGVINVDDKILPLYGRRIRDRWNYYTRTDTYNPVPIPIQYKKRDCMEDIGCNELMTGDEIKVEVMNKQGKVNIYKYDGPKYIGFM